MSDARLKKWYGDNGKTVVIGDDERGEFITEPTPPGHNRATEAVPLAGANYAKQYDHGNRQNHLTWTVDRQHATAAEAFRFSRTHHAELDTHGSLEDTAHGTSLFLNDATIQTECLSWVGTNTIFRYTVTGGEWSTKRSKTT